MEKAKTKEKEVNEADVSVEPAEDKKNGNGKSKTKPAASATKKKKESNKIKELQDKLARLEEENQMLKDQNLRKVAEFENYKRRTEREFLSVLQNANEALITELLPVIDDFERFLDHADNTESKDSLTEGMQLIYKKMLSILEKQGLKVMESIGQEFDAEKHQALMQVESDKHESGYIVDEHLKGYTLNDKVIRHSQVLVAK